MADAAQATGGTMPDVWTKHPEIVRSLLQEGGFRCGVPPRVLKPRDPEWTCIIDGKTISGDIYIHHVDTLRKERGGLFELLPWMMLVGLVVGWGVGRWKNRWGQRAQRGSL